MIGVVVMLDGDVVNGVAESFEVKSFMVVPSRLIVVDGVSSAPKFTSVPTPGMPKLPVTPGMPIVLPANSRLCLAYDERGWS